MSNPVLSGDSEFWLLVKQCEALGYFAVSGATVHSMQGRLVDLQGAATTSGGGDMTKAVYDTDADNVVDKAAALSTPGAAKQFWKNGNTWAQVDVSDLTGAGSGFTPSAHATTHKSGGTDAIKLDELAATTDVPTLNASPTAHGLLPKLSNVAAQFLNGTGVFSAPSAATATVTGYLPTPPNDATQIIRGDATWGALPAFTVTTASFTCPAFFASVAGVLIASAPWLAVGDTVFIALAGKFIVSAKASNTSITIWNDGSSGNASSGTIAAGAGVRMVAEDIGEAPVYPYQDHFLVGLDASSTNNTGKRHHHGS